ncbi:hypothetical protein CPC08DRAFT_754685 [Agrocybe pediades]|nr:hypothetical protein CPC08DRAFT_754685 [Agrocybe pediades]
MTSAENVPPLIGDEHGVYRIQIVGNSGAGKSTTGIALSKMLGIPYISLDEIMFQPGWVQTSPEEFRAKLQSLLDQSPQGWIVDGNYDKRGGLLAFERSTDVIWLDPPLILYFPRLVLRTFLRLFRLAEPCSPGCFEKPSEVFFSKESIIWWCLSQHCVNRRRNRARMQEVGIGVGRIVECQRMRRLGGWGSAVKKWLMDVEAMVKSR